MIFFNVTVAIYGCETWSLTLRKAHKLRVFENRVFRRIFGPKDDKVGGACSANEGEEELI
jgi:hypothetical protein